MFALWRALRLSVVALGLAVAGCAGAPSGSPEGAAETNSGPPATNASPAAPPPVIDLPVVDKDGLAAAVGKHRGKVVVVDFWATWCGPCVEQFPHTVELARRFADEPVAVIAVSLDDASDPASVAAVKEFLTKQNARFETLITRYPIGVEQFEAFDLNSVPTYALFDKQGRPRARSEGDGAELANQVRALLQERD